MAKQKKLLSGRQLSKTHRCTSGSQSEAEEPTWVYEPSPRSAYIFICLPALLTEVEITHHYQKKVYM